MSANDIGRHYSFCIPLYYTNELQSLLLYYLIILYKYYLAENKYRI